MDVVLRHANDRFLQEVAFPCFTLGMTDARAAIGTLLESVGDHRTKVLAELLIEQCPDGGLDVLEESSAWREVVYRLLFSDWLDGGVGWQVAAEPIGYAGALDQALNLALMLEHPDYPYGAPAEAAAYRAAFLTTPVPDFTFASLIAGLWHPPAAFYPEWVLATAGRAETAGDHLLMACADWAHRDRESVGALHAQLPNLLERLIAREQERLLFEVPEAPELIAYWNGKVTSPPMLSVAFSGLGQEASSWIRELGQLTAVVRNAVRARRGLTSLVTRGTSRWER